MSIEGRDEWMETTGSGLDGITWSLEGCVILFNKDSSRLWLFNHFAFGWSQAIVSGYTQGSHAQTG